MCSLDCVHCWQYFVTVCAYMVHACLFVVVVVLYVTLIAHFVVIVHHDQISIMFLRLHQRLLHCVFNVFA